MTGFCVLGFLLYSFSQIRLMRKPAVSTE